ncbi:MAG TPA: hypothetical protein VMM84_09165 [Pyrinomonadaceae bacterium]|nr:hypothetical protein [Pyrinomonadaceae bacterium]
MNKNHDIIDKPRQGEGIAADETSEITEVVKKKTFVEPELSVPVDVLEATTFFQAVDTGSTE